MVRRHAPRDALIRPGLILFGRQFVAYQVEKLGTVQADAVRAVVQDVFQFSRQFDIGRQLDAPSVPSLRGQVVEFLQLMLQHRQLGLRFPVPPDRLGIRIEMDHPAVSVDDDHHAVRYGLGGDVGPHHRRHGQTAGDDRRMRRLATGVGDEAADRFPVYFRGIRGGQAVRYEHDFPVHSLNPGLCAAGELRQHPVMHVFEIGGPFPEEWILYRGVIGDPSPHHVVEDILRVGQLTPDAHDGNIHHFRIFEYGLVCAEDLPDVLVEIHRDAALQPGQIVQRLVDGGPEPLDFRLHAVGGDRTLVYGGEASVIDKGASYGNARRCRYAFQYAALLAHVTAPDPCRTCL